MTNPIRSLAEGRKLAEGPERIVASYLAVGLLLIYVLMGAILLLTAVHDPDLWGREIKIFEALSPLAAGAVGWVFGKEVHRQAAEDYRRDARNGQSLAAAIRYATKDLPADDSNDDESQKHLRSILGEAMNLFPA